MKLPSSIRKIAVFRALQLGDMLCAIPAIRALRQAFPEAHITLIGLPWARELILRFPHYFNDLIVFPGYPGLPEQDFDPARFADFLQEVVKENFDLLINLHGSGQISNPLVQLFGAKQTAGFYLKSNFCPNPNLFLEYPVHLHEVQRHLALIEYLGIPSAGTELEFPITEKDRTELAALQLPLTTKKYACIHPGSRDANRQWPPEYFAALGNYCSAQGLDVVLTGTKEELHLVAATAAHLDKAPIMAAGKTSLGAIGALIENAALLIANCTGVSHIAAALKTPSFIISMDGEPERWTPMNKQLHPAIDWTKMPDFDLAMARLQDLLAALLSAKLPQA